jgi:hypothetical protein
MIQRILWVQLRIESQLIHSLTTLCEVNSKTIEGIAKVLEIFEITGLKENVIQIVYQWLATNV